MYIFIYIYIVHNRIHIHLHMYIFTHTWVYIYIYGLDVYGFQMCFNGMYSNYAEGSEIICNT